MSSTGARVTGLGVGARSSRRVVGVVLAAGAGTRYGAPKVTAAQGDWLHTAVRALADGGCDEVVVTLGAARVAVPPPARAVVVAQWSDGLSASVRAGLDAAQATGPIAGVVLLVVDTPDTRAAHVHRVLAATRSRPDSLARAVFDGRPGHPVYLGSDHLSAVANALTGDRGAGAFLGARDDVIDVECADLSDGRDIDF